VAVLNVDLLPNSSDTVVIGDRLFSLPIQVEGLEENELHVAQMDVDNGYSSDGHNMEGREDGPSNINGGRQGNRADSSIPSQPQGTSNNDKQVDCSVAEETGMKMLMLWKWE
jgi:hypothetical protein